MDKVVAVADFFHVSVDCLMGKAENRTTPEDLKRWSEDKEIQDVVRSYEGDDDMKLLFKTSKSLSPEKNPPTTYPGSILIQDGASLDLAGKNLTVGTITNNGTLRLLGTETINAAMSNGTSDNSTVEYYGTTVVLNTLFENEKDKSN